MWYSEVEEQDSDLREFSGLDPNAELTEINVRNAVSILKRRGSITLRLRGFRDSAGGLSVGAPTADQPGMWGTLEQRLDHRGHNLHDAKCSAISLGKEASTGHNLRTLGNRKPGYQYQMEAVFLALQSGWSKEKIGSHIVRNNSYTTAAKRYCRPIWARRSAGLYNNHIYNIGVNMNSSL